MIGLDFPKIEFELFGLDLLEPMALVTDTLLGGLSLFFAYKMAQKIKSDLPFYKNWMWFFIIFGAGAFLGGIGHTFYNQLGIPGKIPSWLAGPLSIYFLEKAMISLHWNEKLKKNLNKLSIIKMIIVYVIFLIILTTADVLNNLSLPFLPIAFNTIVGVVSAAGILGFKYTEKLSAKFKFFWLGVLIMIPTAFIFLLKINVHPWFDKNDFSHVLFMIGITYFYLGVLGLSNGLKQKVA